MQEIKEYSGTWREIWEQKGKEPGTVDDVYIYGGWNKSNGSKEEAHREIKRIFDKLVKELDISPDSKVLELGSGAGAYAMHFRDYLTDGMYCGVDFSQSLVDKCNKFFGCGNVISLCSEASDLPFRDAYFDVVFCYGLFFYFADESYAEKVIKEMERVSKRVCFVGEIAHSSQHETKHLLISKNRFMQISNNKWQISDSWYSYYKDERYNAKFNKP